MDEETLQQIRDYLGYPEVRFDEAMLFLDRLLPPLLDKHRALCEIAEMVARVPDDDYVEECPFCHESPGYTSIQHASDCPVTKARALLGKGE